MSARSRERSRELAAYLKAHKVERTTGQCPMNCGRPIKVGGQALLEHLAHCHGGRRKASY